MSIKTRKIKLIAVGETAKDRTKVYNYIKKVADDLTQVGNEVIRLHVCNQYEIDRLKGTNNISKGDAIKILQDSLGTSIRNSGYQLLTKFPYISSEVRTCFNSVIYKTISDNFYDILKGKVSIPSFRKSNLSIPFSANNDKETGITNELYTEGDRYYIQFPLSGEERKIHKKVELSLFFGKDRSNNRIIVDRILNGEYKLCDSNFKIEDNDIYLLITYKQPDSIKPEIDVNKVMGIDLGINRPVSIYISNEKNQPQQINIGLKIQHERMKFYKHRKSLQESLKYSKGGHGRSRKMKSLEDLKDKEKNWSQLINHTISREVIRIANEYNVGVIHMEDLTGITTNSKDYFMKSWAYYQLQTYIVYKAKELGITILWVDPKNTSNTCPTCKVSEPLNRNDKDKTKFRCVNLNCKDFDKDRDADIVGAFNITHTLGLDVKSKSKEGRMKKGKEKKLMEQV